MLSKDEIETCKGEAKNYIEFMETAGDNAGWDRGLLWYIEEMKKQIYKISKNPFNELKVNGIRFYGEDIKQYFEKEI